MIAILPVSRFWKVLKGQTTGGLKRGNSKKSDIFQWYCRSVIQVVKKGLRPKDKNVSGFWSRAHRLRPRISICSFLGFPPMKRCPIAAKIAGLIGILPCCVSNDIFHIRGMSVCPDLWGLSQPPYFMYGKFCLVAITAYIHTCISYFTGWQKRKDYQKKREKSTDFEADLFGDYQMRNYFNVISWHCFSILFWINKTIITKKKKPCAFEWFVRGLCLGAPLDNLISIGINQEENTLH